MLCSNTLNFHIQNQKWRWWGWQNNEMPICCICSHFYNNIFSKADMWFYEFETGSRWCRLIFHIFSFCIMFWIWNLLLLGFFYTISHSEFVLWNFKCETCWCWFHVSIIFLIWNSLLLVSCNISHSLTVWRTQSCNTISPSSQEISLQKIPSENDPTFEQRILKHEHGLVGTLKHEQLERRGFIERIEFFCTTLRKVSSTSSVQCTMSPLFTMMLQ